MRGECGSPWVAENRGLKYLNLAVNELTDIPEELSKITDLEVLLLHKNKIRKFPAHCPACKISYFNLYLNRFRYIPEEYGASKH